MIKCKNCGYENNDGSHICLNCREQLSDVTSSSDAEKYIRINQEAIERTEASVRKANKTTAVVIVSVIVILILGIVIYFANLYKPVIDERLLGSWQYQGYGFTDVWTFEKDGTYNMTRSGTGIFSEGINAEDWHYRAEDGKLKTSWSKNVEEYTSATYTYQFGTTESGVECLILTQTSVATGTSQQILYRVD